MCRQIHLTRVFSHAPGTCDHTHLVVQGVFGAHSFHLHAIHDVTCLSVRLLSFRVCLFPVSLPLLPCLFHCLPLLCPAHHLQCRHRRGLKTTALTHNEEYCPVAMYNSLTRTESSAEHAEHHHRLLQDLGAILFTRSNSVISLNA